MRILTIGVLAAAALGCVSTANAADLDYDVLRGAEYEPAAAPVIDWSGAYLGGHGGYSSANYGFKNVFHDLLYDKVHGTTAESEFGLSSLLHAGSKRVEGGSFGAFAGYNVQLDDLIVGIEGDYTHFGAYGASSDSLGRSKVRDDGIAQTVTASGTSSTKLQDYGTIRARVGYAIGSFLPFVTGGLAIGRAQIVDKVSYQNYGFDQTTYKSNVTNGTNTPYYNFGYASFSYADPYAGVGYTTVIPARMKTKIVGGVSLGAGLEYAITSNILLRGEYQYVLFNDFDGHKVNVNTVRGGAALKF